MRTTDSEDFFELPPVLVRPHLFRMGEGTYVDALSTSSDANKGGSL